MHYAYERNNSELELEQEKILFGSLLETIPDRIYFKDRKSRFIRVNLALAHFFQLEKPEDAIGKTDFDFFLPEHAGQAFEDEQEILRTEKPMMGKVEKETFPDGRVGWSLTTKLPLRDKHGRLIGTMGLSRDITRMKRMEEELGAERNMLRSVIENIPDPIFVKDAEGHYLLDNAAHFRSLGAAQRQDVIGRTSFGFLSGRGCCRLQGG